VLQMLRFLIVGFRNVGAMVFHVISPAHSMGKTDLVLVAVQGAPLGCVRVGTRVGDQSRGHKAEYRDQWNLMTRFQHSSSMRGHRACVS
jgi:hypothetical protein